MMVEQAAPNKAPPARRRRLLTVLWLVLALAVSAAVLLSYEEPAAGVRPTPAALYRPELGTFTPVIVALEPITRGYAFYAGSIGRQEWPVKFVPPEIIGDESETIGRLARSNIAPGQVIRRSLLLGIEEWSITSTPVISHGVAYFARYEGLLFAANPLTGQELWEFPVGHVPAPPLLAGETLYVLGSGPSAPRPGVNNSLSLYAINARTGWQKWKFSRAAIPETLYQYPPLVAGDTVYVKSRQTVYAIDSGRDWEKWRFEAASEIESPLTAGGQTIYFTDAAGTFYALAAESGAEKWRTSPAWPEQPADRMASVGGISYLGRPDGRLAAVAMDTGREIWSVPLGQVAAAPVIAGDGLFVIGDGILYALDKWSGLEVWRLEGLQVADPDPSHTIALAGAVVVAKDTTTLYAVSALTGREVWRFEADQEIASPVAASTGLVSFTDSSGAFYAVDAQTGRLRWWVRPERFENWVR